MDKTLRLQIEEKKVGYVIKEYEIPTDLHDGVIEILNKGSQKGSVVPNDELAAELTHYLNNNNCFAHNIIEEDGFTEEPMDVRRVEVEVDGELTTILDSWSEIYQMDTLIGYLDKSAKKQ